MIDKFCEERYFSEVGEQGLFIGLYSGFFACFSGGELFECFFLYIVVQFI
jgi:hypothetical protein